MKAYYGSRFSPNMTKTPEGFLVCHNVPISRVGWQEYLGQELGLEEYYDQMIQVYRSPEEVFNAAAIASFEGKPATDEHPSDWVRPDNVSAYSRGHVQNVRQGSGEESDLLLADLFFTDPVLISEIEHGKREVSCGYDCTYEPMGDGKYQQKQIRGNHVAVVVAGRAGDRVAIKDNKPERRVKTVKMDKKTIFGKMLTAFVRDAEPEEAAAAAEMAPDIMKGKDAEIPPAAAPAASEEAGEGQMIAVLNQKIDQLAAIVTKLVESDKQVHSEVQPKDALTELEQQIQKPEEDSLGEESVTVPVEAMADEAPVSDPDDRPENPIPGADRNSMLQAIRTLKPVVAGIKDAKERKAVSDAMAKAFRQTFGISASPKTKDSGYAGILKATQANVKKATDGKTTEDLSNLGKEWARKYNPHYKNQ